MSSPQVDALAAGARNALSLGNYRDSAALYAKALALTPRSAGLYFEIGMLSCLLGDFAAALGIFRQALQHDGDFVPALRCGSAILLWQSRPGDALVLAGRLLRHSGNSAVTHGLLARIYEALGQPEQQRAALERAAHCNLVGSDRSSVGPRSGTSDDTGGFGCEQWVQHGVTQRVSGNLRGACDAFRTALEQDPVSALPHLQLGMTLALLGRSAEAVQCLGNAVRLDPQNAEALSRWGAELVRLGKTNEGVTALENALKLRPDAPETLRFLGSGLLQSGRQEEGVQVLRRAVTLQPDNASLRSQLLTALNFIPVANRTARFEEFKTYSTLFEEPILRRHPSDALKRFQTNAPGNPGRRIRIGYVSGDFRNHSVSFFFEPLLKQHNRTKFEVFCYMTRSESDAVTERLRRQAEHWRDVAPLSPADIAGQVRADEIDILVDLSSHTAENRLPAFAYKPAPVQVTMIGLMQTTGMRSIDYRITDALLDPTGESECFNSETLWRLKSGPFVFSPPPDAPEPGDLPASTGSKIMLACTNDLEKVTPAVCSLWARVLHSLPEARLLFFGRPGNRMRSDLERHGVAPDRLLEQERRPLREFLAMHQRIDLALDPFPYNGLTVTLLSAWMGVPCVTLEGKCALERAAGSLLRRLGLPEFVARSEEDYLRKVLAVVSDLPRLAAVRQSLRGRVRERLCDAPRHVAELENAFLEMLAAAASRSS